MSAAMQRSSAETKARPAAALLPAAHMPVEATSPARRAQLLKLVRDMPANDTATQHARILAAIRTGALTTHECRQYLDVVQPTTRIHELRAKGYNIVTQWARQETAYGRVHRFGRYTLMRGKPKGAQ